MGEPDSKPCAALAAIHFSGGFRIFSQIASDDPNTGFCTWGRRWAGRSSAAATIRARSDSGSRLEEPSPAAFLAFSLY